MNDCAEFANGTHKGLDIEVLHIPAFGNALRRGGTGRQHHSLTAKFIEFYVEINVGLRPLYESAAHRFKPLHELPWDAAYHEIVVLRKDTDRCHKPVVAIPPRKPQRSMRAVLAP